MIQIELSKILQEFHNFQEECGQLYIKVDNEFKWFDMLYSTDDHKLHLFLYILHKYACSRKLYIGYERLHLVDDSSSFANTEEESIFSIDTFYVIEPLLQYYNITTANYPDADPKRRLAVVSLEDFESCAKSGEGLLNYCKQVCEHLNMPLSNLDEMTPTEVFIDCKIGTSTRDYITSIRILTSQGYIFNYINAGYSSYEEEVILQAPISPRYDNTTIDGWTLINGRYLWWIITHLPEDERSYETLISFYNYLVAVPTTNIYISSKGLLRNENAAAYNAITFQPTTDYFIPRDVIYTLALVHVNTGKVIEFVGMQQRYRDMYLRAVAEYEARDMCELKDRIDAFSRVQLNSLYLTFVHRSILPIQITQKSLNLKFRVVLLKDIVSRINTTSSGYTIASSITDTLPFNEWSAEDFDMSKLEFQSIFNLIEGLLPIESTPETFQEVAIKTESFIYALLRLLEQKFFSFSRVKTVADLIAFKYNSEVYIGFGAIKPEYTGEVFLCAGDVSSIQHTVASIIPSSVLIEEEPSDVMLDELLKVCTVSKPTGFDDRSSKLLILALSSTKVPGLPFTLKDNIGPTGLDNPVDVLLRASLCRDCNYVIRKEIWNSLTQHFTSFGLRVLNIHTAPLTIYGGLNVTMSDRARVQVYPIAFDKFPRRAVNDI